MNKLITDIKITIEYKDMSGSEWKVLEITPDEYFDYDFVDDDLSWESVPLFDNAYEYLPIERKMIQMTKLIIIDEQNEITRKIFESFWDEGNSRVSEVIEEGTGTRRHELILDVLFSKKSNVTQIFRCHKEDGVFKPSYFGLITENDDGTETEEKLL
jgi:hypothetical protein